MARDSSKSRRDMVDDEVIQANPRMSPLRLTRRRGIGPRIYIFICKHSRRFRRLEDAWKRAIHFQRTLSPTGNRERMGRWDVCMEK